LKLISERKNIK